MSTKMVPSLKLFGGIFQYSSNTWNLNQCTRPLISSCFNLINSKNGNRLISLNNDLSASQKSSLFLKNQSQNNQFTQSRNIGHQELLVAIPRKIKMNFFNDPEFPDKYTTRKLRMKKLGGRDTRTGAIIYGRVGGGNRRRYMWLQNDRMPSDQPDPYYERVISVQYDPNRTPLTALVGNGVNLRYITATINMKNGDLIKSTRDLPRIPIQPKPGNAHPVGALPPGTQICQIEKLPGTGAKFVVTGGSSTRIKNVLPNGRIVISITPRRAVAFDPECLAVVGQNSNPNHARKVIGSAQRLRWLGMRPNSGLFRRKDELFGHRYKPPIPITPFKEEIPYPKMIRLTLYNEGKKRGAKPKVMERS